jgi:hypothetical protein
MNIRKAGCEDVNKVAVSRLWFIVADFPDGLIHLYVPKQ